MRSTPILLVKAVENIRLYGNIQQNRFQQLCSSSYFSKVSKVVRQSVSTSQGKCDSRLWQIRITRNDQGDVYYFRCLLMFLSCGTYHPDDGEIGSSMWRDDCVQCPSLVNGRPTAQIGTSVHTKQQHLSFFKQPVSWLAIPL